MNNFVDTSIFLVLNSLQLLQTHKLYRLNKMYLQVLYLIMSIHSVKECKDV